MPRSFYSAVFLAIFVLFAHMPLAAEHSPFFSFGRPDDSVQIIGAIERYLAIPEHGVISLDSIDSYAVDEFATWLQKAKGLPLRLPKQDPYTIANIRPFRPDGSRAIVTIVTDVTDVPFFGPYVLDWVFFVRSTENGWRISNIRRQSRTDNVIKQLRALDSANQYPASLKPIIAREISPMLMHNARLREHFNSHRDAFTQLAGQFHRSDSLRIIARTDRSIILLNSTSLDWGIAGQEIPKEVVDEFMATANPEQQKYMRKQLEVAAAMRRDGRERLAGIARRLHLDTARLDTVVNLMHDVGVGFINSQLPWKKSVQFTLGGLFDDAVGYIYAPGDGPYISDEEYFYLEELGDGWWIFRST